MRNLSIVAIVVFVFVVVAAAAAASAAVDPVDPVRSDLGFLFPGMMGGQLAAPLLAQERAVPRAAIAPSQATHTATTATAVTWKRQPCPQARGRQDSGHATPLHTTSSNDS